LVAPEVCALQLFLAENGKLNLRQVADRSRPRPWQMDREWLSFGRDQRHCPGHESDSQSFMLYFSDPQAIPATFSGDLRQGWLGALMRVERNDHDRE
jgi:hypothetical protein